MSAALFGSDNPMLDARLEGVIYASAAVGSSDHYYSFTESVKFNGLEFYAWDSNPGDYMTLSTEYYAGAQLGWLRYKKFGKKWYIFPNHKERVLLFPTTPGLGVRLRVTYQNNGASAVDIAVNIFKFTDQEIVDTGVGAEGTDW